MLDDKNDEIEQLKSVISDREAEIRAIHEEHDAEVQRSYFEDKLQQEYEQNQKLIDKNADLSSRLAELEDEFERLTEDYQVALDKIERLEDEIEEKKEILSDVAKEVEAIKYMNSNDKAEIEKYRKREADLVQSNKELYDIVLQKNTELRAMVERFDKYKVDKKKVRRLCFFNIFLFRKSTN